MHFSTFRPTYLAVAVVASAGILAGGFALRPALAGGRVAASGQAVVNCSGSSPCQTYHNSGKGAALLGTTAKGIGLEATATTTGNAFEAFAVNGYAVYAKSSAQTGVTALSTSGYGLYGSSTNSTGIVGYSGASAGVYAASGSSGSGVYGVSNSGFGVEAHSNATAIVGYSDGANGSTALVGEGNTGRGIDAVSSGNLAAYVINNGSGNGLDATGPYIGVLGRSGNYPILATDLAANDLFYIDGAGDVFYHGTLNTFARTHNGGAATAFGSKTTSPTIEDNGSGQLVNGVATVLLDPTFAQTIDSRVVYHVMLTPDGDTRGLFVASKSPRSFVVREVQGGHGSVSFDYHIYATPLGNAGARMTVMDRASSFGPKASPITFRAPKPTSPIVHHI